MDKVSSFVSKYKWYIVVFLVLVVYVSLVLLANRLGLFNKVYKYIVLPDLTVFKYDKGWSIVSNENDRAKVLSDNLFNIYVDGQLYENYTIENGSRLHVYDSGFNLLDVSNGFVASNTKFNFLSLESNQFSESDYSVLNGLLLSESIYNYGSFSVQEKYVYDFDNDSVLESLFVVSNVVFSDEDWVRNIDVFFSIVYLVKDGNVHMINKSMAGSPYGLQIYDLLAIFDDGSGNGFNAIVSVNSVSLKDNKCAYIGELYGKYRKIVGCD